MQRHFASNDEILGVTTTIDINGAIRALNDGASWEEAKRLCPVGGPVVHCNADGTVQVIDDDSHSVTFASTGRGKTRRFIYPTLYADICSGTNIVVNDMKGEIYATCRGLLDLAGYTTYVLDLRDTSKSPHRYNPLGIAWDEWHQGKHDSAFVYLRNFALSMFDALATNTTDAFWPNSAVDYFMGLSLGLLEAGCSRDEFTIESVARMDRMGNEKSSGFGRNDTKLKAFFERFDADSLALQNASGTIYAPNDTKASILSVFRSPMALYAGQRDLMDTLARSDFDAEELTHERRALFVISPDETHAFGPVVVGILNQLMSAMISVAQRSYGGVLPNRVDFVLDEMGNLPSRIPDMEALVSAARSRNMRFHFVLQSAAQLGNVYGNDLKEVILDNCDTWVYMGSRGLDFLKRISDLTGEVQLESGRVRPLLSVEKLQHLETRATETETLVFVSSLKPYVTPLKDVSRYTTPLVTHEEPPVKEAIERTVFDLNGYLERASRDSDDGGFSAFMEDMLRHEEPTPQDTSSTRGESIPEGTVDIDAILADIDAKIAELDEQERAAKEQESQGEQGDEDAEPSEQDSTDGGESSEQDSTDEEASFDPFDFPFPDRWGPATTDDSGDERDGVADTGDSDGSDNEGNEGGAPGDTLAGDDLLRKIQEILDAKKSE